MEVFNYGSVKPKLHDFLLSAGISLKETTVWSGKLGWGVCGASEALEIPQLENQGSSQQVPPRKGPKRPAMKSSSWEEGGADREGPSWSEDLGTSGLSKSAFAPQRSPDVRVGTAPQSSSQMLPRALTDLPMGVILGQLPQLKCPDASAPPLLLGVKIVL